MSSTNRTHRTRVRKFEKYEHNVTELQLVRQLCPFVRATVEYTKKHRGVSVSPKVYVLGGTVGIETLHDSENRSTIFTLYFKNDKFNRTRPIMFYFNQEEIEFNAIRVRVSNAGHARLDFNTLGFGPIVRNAQLNARRVPSTIKLLGIQGQPNRVVDLFMIAAMKKNHRCFDLKYTARIKMVLNALMQCGFK